jgi:hypothetical protein
LPSTRAANDLRIILLEHQANPSTGNARMCGIANILQEFRQQRIGL